MKLIEACIYIGLGIVLGMLIGHARAADDYTACWNATQHLTLAERVSACSPILNNEWKFNRGRWREVPQPK